MLPGVIIKSLTLCSCLQIYSGIFYFAFLVMIDAHYFFFKKQTVQKQEGKSKISWKAHHLEVTCIQTLGKISLCIYVVRRHLVLSKMTMSRFSPQQIVLDSPNYQKPLGMGQMFKGHFGQDQMSCKDVCKYRNKGVILHEWDIA